MGFMLLVFQFVAETVDFKEETNLESDSSFQELLVD